MDSFEYQTITALKKIRNANRRPDAKKIFKTITKESASNLTLDDVQQKLHEMQSSSKLRNTPYQGLDSYYIVQSDTGDTITSSEDILKYFVMKLILIVTLVSMFQEEPLQWLGTKLLIL